MNSCRLSIRKAFHFTFVHVLCGQQESNGGSMCHSPKYSDLPERMSLLHHMLSLDDQFANCLLTPNGKKSGDTVYADLRCIQNCTFKPSLNTFKKPYSVPSEFHIMEHGVFSPCFTPSKTYGWFTVHLAPQKKHPMNSGCFEALRPFGKYPAPETNG